MTEYLVKCNKCKIVLSKKLTKMSITEFKEFDKSDYDRNDYIPEGLFYQTPDNIIGICEIPKNNIIINLKDIKNYAYHDEGWRLTGCCGPGGNHGLNIKCIKGHEVGTESSDCIGTHLIHFENHNVYLYQLNNNLEKLILFIRDRLTNEDIESLKILIDNQLEKNAFLLIVERLYMSQVKIDSYLWDLIIQNVVHLKIESSDWIMLKELLEK